MPGRRRSVYWRHAKEHLDLRDGGWTIPAAQHGDGREPASGSAGYLPGHQHGRLEPSGAGGRGGPLCLAFPAAGNQRVQSAGRAPFPQSRDQTDEEHPEKRDLRRGLQPLDRVLW